MQLGAFLLVKQNKKRYNLFTDYTASRLKLFFNLRNNTGCNVAIIRLGIACAVGFNSYPHRFAFC